jgi:hypothetical protein
MPFKRSIQCQYPTFSGLDRPLDLCQLILVLILSVFSHSANVPGREEGGGGVEGGNQAQVLGLGHLEIVPLVVGGKGYAEMGALFYWHSWLGPAVQLRDRPHVSDSVSDLQYELTHDFNAYDICIWQQIVHGIICKT